MPITETTAFRNKYKDFIKWTKYMSEKMYKVDIAKFRDKWIPKFENDVCDPLNKAWQALTDAERETFFPENTSVDTLKENALDKRLEAINAKLPDAPF